MDYQPYKGYVGPTDTIQQGPSPYVPHEPSVEKPLEPQRHPTHNHRGFKVTKGIQPVGESGRRFINPWKFLKICFRSSNTVSKYINLLWPIVPVAIALGYLKRDTSQLLVFIVNYIAMVPSANLLGFAGQELARKVPKVFGVLLEISIGSSVEIILFMVLLSKGQISVIKDAIMGSILANLLLCLGLCFFFGGLRQKTQEFDEAVSEVGSGLLLVAGMALLVPAAFNNAVSNLPIDPTEVVNNVLRISRITAIFLLVAYFIYIFFQMRTHHGIYDMILEQDEAKDLDQHHDAQKDLLTFTEAVLAIIIAVTCVSLHAIFLVEEIPFIVKRYAVSEFFLGLILVPVVEKAAEHLTAVDEAWDNQMNLALSHILGSTVQTALFNTPLVVIVGWGLKKSMDLNFVLFLIVMVVLSILVVGNFLKDGKSNYLEGSLCVIVYLIIATTTWFYPAAEPADDSSVPT
ncbi:MAG: hypothetical protein M1829_001332 [Trizodia sp. TS-e1964]|nr:MAG: hypothetical protein M1829_001332 [Trizodia sp. TS-e1964]